MVDTQQGPSHIPVGGTSSTSSDETLLNDSIPQNEPESAGGSMAMADDTESGASEGDAASTEGATPDVNLDLEDDDDDDDGPVVIKDKKDIALAGIDPATMALGINVFDDLPLHARLKEAVAKIGWTAPTPVQKLCLPYTLRGRDVAGFAQTGTGKTGVFLLTIANKLLEPASAEADRSGPRAFVIAPTRELAMQIEQDAADIFGHVGLTSLAVFGGIDYDKQAKRLKDGVDVVVATPGRLMDYIKKGVVHLKSATVFVCDEADRMFDMGFIDDVEFFMKRIPAECQRLLFSATTSEQVKELAFEYLETPEYISVTPETITPEKIDQHAIHCHATNKLKVMLGLLRDHSPGCSIIFTNTKLTAEWLHYKLENNGIEVDLITGDLPQKKRIKLIHTIKEGKLKALIATDVASRGLHIAGVSHVYNFDLPDDPSNYIHRVGRTARAGAKGSAYSLVCDDYGQNLAGINQLLGDTLAMKSEWFDENYLKIEDKAGNPFQDRYKHMERYRDMGPDDGDGSAGGGDRGPRNGGDRGPRNGGDRGPRNGGGRGDRPERNAGGPDRDNKRPQGGGRGGPQGGGRGGPGKPNDGHRDQQSSADASGDPNKKKRRRRRGKGGGRDDVNVQGDGRGPQGQNARSGQNPQQGGRHQGGRPGHQGGTSAGLAKAGDTAPKGFFGLMKRFFGLLFGRK